MRQIIATSFPRILYLLCFLTLFAGRELSRAGETEQCFVCGASITGAFYKLEDKVTLEKRNVCKDCETSFPACFVCGLPAGTSTPGRQLLSDGRVLCARDAGTAVLQVDDAVRVCRETWERVERMFSRFISFPQNNVRIRMVDRVHLLELFKSVGNDYESPNVWGFTQTTNIGPRFEHQISVLGGMPVSFFQATCAHEYAHTWINENLNDSRRRTLSKDAEEAFCELVAYLFADSLNDAEEKARILKNGYTRGQIDLFITTEQQFGFNDIAEWIKSGADDRLDKDDPARIRKVITPQRIAQAPSAPRFYPLPPSPAAQNLTLKAVFWDQTHPTALINDHTFALNETGKVRLGNTNVVVRCLAIRKEAVRVQIAGSGQEQELFLKTR
jgi:hypothetical protein